MNNKNWDEVIELTSTLVEFDTYEEKGKTELFLYLKEYIEKKCNAEIEIFHPNTNNVYMIAKAECVNPIFRLLLQGHMDVVIPGGMNTPYKPNIVDGKMYGRGTCDMKSGCAATIIAFIEAIKEEGHKGNIYLAFSSDEEYAAEQMVEAMEEKHLPKCDFCIIPEPSNNNVIYAHKGTSWVELEFFGKTAHASNHTLGDNAIYKAAEFVNKLREYQENIDNSPATDTFGKPTVSVDLFNGGTGANIVPESCKVVVDKRYLPSENINTTLAEYDTILNTCSFENNVKKNVL